MEDEIVFERYVYYRQFLKKLGEWPINSTPTVKELGITRGAIQAAYGQIEKEKFTGTIIDYLCLVSALYLRLEYKKRHGREPKQDPDWVFSEFLESYSEYSSDINNLVRLVLKDPNYYLELSGYDVNEHPARSTTLLYTVSFLWGMKFVADKIGKEELALAIAKQKTKEAGMDKIHRSWISSIDEPVKRTPIKELKPD